MEMTKQAACAPLAVVLGKDEHGENILRGAMPTYVERGKPGSGEEGFVCMTEVASTPSTQIGKSESKHGKLIR